MKFLKTLFESNNQFFKTKEEIKKWLDDAYIQNYDCDIDDI